ncbi:TetR/AcrR family transcriptional regulator [Paludibaculum fermentans]|uniref:TetR/AcrR family transcriptional regulator n=1 Tax=Paludibaculum fermentans TaxID=1473598 RepID=UPI003EBEA29E
MVLTMLIQGSPDLGVRGVRSSKTAPVSPLSPTDWLKHGLSALAAGGPRALRAEVLARELGVSRGSFYWHFQSLDDFHAQLLSFWTHVAVDKMIDLHERAAASPQSRLKAIVLHAFTTDLRFERAMRAWSLEAERVATALAQIDARRTAYLSRLLRAAGHDQKSAAARARLMYTAFVGFVVRPSPADARGEQLANFIVSTLLKRNPTS